MRVLFILSIFWCSFQTFGASVVGFDFSKFKTMSYSQKVELIKTYQKLAARVDEQSQKTMKFKFSLNRSEAFMQDLETYARLTQHFFIAEAVAQNFDVNKKCAFAGWVADYDQKGLCNLVAVKKDKNYSQGACTSRQIVCNPMLFGNDNGKTFCVDAYLPGNRSASHQCMQLSAGVKDQNKHMKDIIARITNDPNSFHQLVLVLQRLCLCEADGTPKNKYRDRIHKPESSSTCAGIIQQLQKLLNVKSDSDEKQPWYCSQFSSSEKLLQIQKDLSGIKAIVDQLEDSKKYDETLNTICKPTTNTGTGTTPVLTGENPNPSTETSGGGTSAGPAATIEVVCTESGECEEEDPKPASEEAITLSLNTAETVNPDIVEIKVTELICKSVKTPTEFVSRHDGCTLTWEAKPALASELDNDVISNFISRGTTEVAITITLSDGTKKEVKTHTIPALETSSTIDSEITSDAAITSGDAIDFGDDTVPQVPQPPFIDMGPPFMFILPGAF